MATTTEQRPSPGTPANAQPAPAPYGWVARPDGGWRRIVGLTWTAPGVTVR
jgi:hypothetical protein